MTRDTIQAAMKDAGEFLRRANIVLAAISPESSYLFDFPRQTGALRRQSMELTRSLAEMRKP